MPESGHIVSEPKDQTAKALETKVTRFMKPGLNGNNIPFFEVHMDSTGGIIRSIAIEILAVAADTGKNNCGAIKQLINFHTFGDNTAKVDGVETSTSGDTNHGEVLFSLTQQAATSIIEIGFDTAGSQDVSMEIVNVLATHPDDITSLEL